MTDPFAESALDPRLGMARADRFRPTRCGVVNLWDYRDEEFVFADGRMVLRGPNGSGKTKALEVLFPFVLDGRVEPRRLNPFAGDERTMKSNLLYRGQESAHAYAWMEFRRGDPAPPLQNPDGAADLTADTGAAEVVTIGAGLRAQRYNDRVTRWYFVVDGQVGRDFSLLGPDDRPLTKRQLAEELGALPATLTDRPVDHRAAVDARLFGLGAARYEQLLTLVLTLRRPQLAKNLDPKGLSRALAEGLRPLDDALIDEAAHSFGDMENVQRTLAGLVQADAAAAAFLAGYTTYLRTHARAECDGLTTRLAAVETSRVALAGALAARERSAAARDAASDNHERARDELRALESRLDSLKASPAYRDREQLNRLADVTADLGAVATRDRRTKEQAEADVHRRATARERAEHAHHDALAAVARSAANLTEAARDAGIGWDAPDNADDGHLHERAAARATAREEDVKTIRAAIAAVAEAARQRDLAERRLDRAQERVAAAQARVAESEARVEAETERLRTTLDAWLAEHRATLDALAVGGARTDSTSSPVPARPDDGFRVALWNTVRTELVAAVEATDAVETGALAPILDAVTADHQQARRDELARSREELDRQLDQIAGWMADRAVIAGERDQAPPPFAARTSSREGRPGAPLWALVDFVPGTDDADAAAIEAALQAANLLDAWVLAPGDSFLDSGAHDPSDAVLTPLPLRRRPSGPTLAQVLTPEPDAPVPVQTIQALLASIALESASAGRDDVGPAPTVGRSGRFRQGIQLGAHHKEQAQYIGTTARARRRTQRLAALDSQIAEGQQVAESEGSTIAALEALLTSLATARRELPATTPLVRAARRVEQEAAALRATNGEFDNARGDFDQAVASVGGAERVLLRAAATRSMPTELVEVDRIAGATTRFERCAAELDTARHTSKVRDEALSEAATEVLRAHDRLAEAAEQAELSRADHQARVQELTTLREAVGVAVDELEREVADTVARRHRAEESERATQRALGDAIDEAGQRKGESQGASTALTSAVTEAQHECRRLAPYARADIRDVLRLPAALPAWPTATEQWPQPVELTNAATTALLDDPDTAIDALPASVVALHQAILAATADLRPTESSLKSSRTRVSASLGELQNQLSAAGHEYRPDWEPVDDVIVVKVADEQGFSSIGEFARRISNARKDQEALLTESEQRILEDALLGRLAHQIHERTTDARDLIAAMNREMRGRRMSSGATIGIGWEMADTLDPEQRAVSRLLDREAAQLSTDELARMRAHFARQIKDLRAVRPDRPYTEILAEALDYRQWRAFILTLVAPDGQEDRLTQARHSTLSGGEQSVSLHLPLFAAAHVMLSSAAPHCPRLLALDEAFAGIDDAGRSELLGLTAQFDLDLFMTGYDLWATYATVPGCAHHDLSHSAVEHTVSALLLVWDGAKILTDAQIDGGSGDLAAAFGSPGTRRRAPERVGFDAQVALEAQVGPEAQK